ncbi:hypothetical protein D9M68_18290 [compost metagenome]
MNASLQWELDWIDENVDKYDSLQHAESVKRNIEKRTVIKDLNARLQVLEQNDGHVRYKVASALELMQLRVNSAKHHDPCPLISDRWVDHLKLLDAACDRYLKSGSTMDAFAVIGLAESSALILYG